MTTSALSARAFAPAGIGNIAVGFDILGASLDTTRTDGEALGDTVTATCIAEPHVRIDAITGLPLPLPRDASSNTAGRAVQALLAHLQQRQQFGGGFALQIHKGIPLGSGLGGSAASAVAAVVAANAACGSPLSLQQLYPFALEGEAVASGAKHGDNVGPQLLGGICYTTADVVRKLPVPADLWTVVVHPDFVLETKRARAALAVDYRIGEFVKQSEHLAGLMLGLYQNDLGLIQANLRDVLVEPRRAPLIPGFADVKDAALAAGALGASISGAGPSVFAWLRSKIAAAAAGEAMVAAFASHGLLARAYVAPLEGRGARVLG
jgi:homoserine kinase